MSVLISVFSVLLVAAWLVLSLGTVGTWLALAHRDAARARHHRTPLPTR